MKTLNTALKLTAIAAVAMTLVACGGGGGGGGSVAQAPVVIPGDWTEGRPALNADGVTIDRSVSAHVSSTYGATSDLAIAHSQGWKGQGTAMFTSITNVDNDNLGGGTVVSSAFKDAVQAAAPGIQDSRMLNGGSFADYETPTKQTYSAFSTSAAQHAAHISILNPTVNMTGIAVKSEAIGANTKFYIAPAIAVSAYVPAVDDTVLTVVENKNAGFMFTDVQTGGNIITGTNAQQLKTAYLAGSAAVIQSKFVNLTNVEVVNYMGRSATDGVFRLGNTLAPRSVR